jgi:hypothetical protein
LFAVTVDAEQRLLPPDVLCKAGHTMTVAAGLRSSWECDKGCSRSAGGVKEEDDDESEDTDEEEERWLCVVCQSNICFDCIRADKPFHPIPEDARLFSHWCLRQDSWDSPGIDIRVGQPLNQTIKIYNNWVKPIEFGTAHEEIVPEDYCGEVVLAAQRVAAYIRYRWPLWEFDKIIFAYATQENPAFYKVHLTNGTLMQVQN